MQHNLYCETKDPPGSFVFSGALTVDLFQCGELSPFLLHAVLKRILTSVSFAPPLLPAWLRYRSAGRHSGSASAAGPESAAFWETAILAAAGNVLPYADESNQGF